MKPDDEVCTGGPWSGMCRACASEINSNAHPGWDRKSKVKSKYNITYDDYCSMHRDQGNSCKICGEQLSLFKTEELQTACVDHDHATGEVRGLLCRMCNIGLGCFQDDTELLDMAMDYLLKCRD